MGHQFGDFALGCTHNFDNTLVAAHGKLTTNKKVPIEVIAACVDTVPEFCVEQKVASQ